MKAKLGAVNWFGCIVWALLCFFPIGGEALAATFPMEDIDSGLTSPAGNYRWLDVASGGQIFD